MTRSSRFLFIPLLLAAFQPLAARAKAPFWTTPRGVSLDVGEAHIEVAAPKPGIFRLRVCFGQPSAPPASIFLDPSETRVAWEEVHEDNEVGVKTGAGELLVDSASGAWRLMDGAGKALISHGSLATLGKDGKTGEDEVGLTIDFSGPFRAYGSGNGGKKDELLKEDGNSALNNGVAVIPYYWYGGGYSALGVTNDDDRPARWNADTGRGVITWSFPGRAAELCLTPAADLRAAAREYAVLSGPPRVPPEWTFGYLQSRWGWEDKSYIEKTLDTFRGHHLPVDAFILDFESYTATPDYSLPPQGEPHFPDFAWNPLLFPAPAVDIASYLARGIHIVAIRKPRIGDSASLEFMHARGWVRPPGTHGEYTEKFDARDLDFENPEVGTWYGEHLRQMIEDGIAGWWNDEGESFYTKYYYWNKAEFDALGQFRPNARHWSVNRAFVPGMQRFGVAAWTGDIDSTWQVLAATPGTLLNWSLAGMPYSACDIGGFNGYPAPLPPHRKGPTPPEMMARWMEEGVFFPVMRAHSTRDLIPHFPWLYGPEAEAAIRKALELRYQLIPYYYSLAHEAWATGLPMMRPLVMEFPDDPNTFDLADQWMLGRGLMAAPILSEGGARRVYFPDDMIAFNGMRTFKRGEMINVAAALDEIPVYVRAGTILPLGPVIEHTDQLPGGPLEARVYPGRDATFDLVEDDGISCDYLKGAIRTTTFTWNDVTRTLNWKQTGGYSGKNVFRQIHAVLFDAAGKKEQSGELTPAGAFKW